MYSSIMAHLDHHKILSEVFISKVRVKHSYCFITSLEAGNQLDAIVLDFSKAFNRMPHKRL